MAKIIKIETREASIKRRLRRHLQKLGFMKGADGLLSMASSGKDVIRSLHSSQRSDRLGQNREFIKEHSADLLKHFANGRDVDPAKIHPVLQRVRYETVEGDLFRLAALTWSVPDRHVGAELLEYLVTGDLPLFDARRLQRSAELLANDISRNSETSKVEVGSQVTVGGAGRFRAPIKVTRADGAIFVVIIAGPLEIDYALHPIAHALNEASSDINIVSVNELTIRGNLPDATNSVLEVVTG